LRRITDDVKVIARDEVALARAELARGLRIAATDAAILVLGGLVALIGFGLLCVSLVAAIEPAVSPLWLRLLLVAVLYLVIGGVAAILFARRLKGDLPPDLTRTRIEARRTAETVQEEIHHVRH
jgi:hypothetical protein